MLVSVLAVTAIPAEPLQFRPVVGPSLLGLLVESASLFASEEAPGNGDESTAATRAPEAPPPPDGAVRDSGTG